MGQRQFQQACIMDFTLVPVVWQAATTVRDAKQSSHGKLRRTGVFGMQMTLREHHREDQRREKRTLLWLKMVVLTKYLPVFKVILVYCNTKHDSHNTFR